MTSVIGRFNALMLPWVSKIETTKDLKAVRKADYFREVKTVLGALDHFKDVGVAHLEDELALAAIKSLTALVFLDGLVTSLVGGKKTREDLWRRLMYWKATEE